MVSRDQNVILIAAAKCIMISLKLSSVSNWYISSGARLTINNRYLARGSRRKGQVLRCAEACSSSRHNIIFYQHTKTTQALSSNSLDNGSTGRRKAHNLRRLWLVFLSRSQLTSDTDFYSITLLPIRIHKHNSLSTTSKRTWCLRRHHSVLLRWCS